VTAVASTGRSARLRGTIVFVSNRGGALDIWKMRASGANPVNLTGDPDPDADPRFSPDGKMLLFCRAPTTEGPWQIWVMDLGGDDRGAVRLTSKGSNYLPDWDPREEE
jgi:Tol biopolymer transport system component